MSPRRRMSLADLAGSATSPLAPLLAPSLLHRVCVCSPSLGWGRGAVIAPGSVQAAFLPGAAPGLPLAMAAALPAAWERLRPYAQVTMTSLEFRLAGPLQHTMALTKSSLAPTVASLWRAETPPRGRGSVTALSAPVDFATATPATTLSASQLAALEAIGPGFSGWSDIVASWPPMPGPESVRVLCMWAMNSAAAMPRRALVLCAVLQAWLRRAAVGTSGWTGSAAATAGSGGSTSGRGRRPGGVPGTAAPLFAAAAATWSPLLASVKQAVGLVSGRGRWERDQ